jgi:geranylgeranyl diphosphate synthase type II
MNDFAAETERLRTLTESCLAGFLPAAGPEAKTLRDAMLYTLGAPGKRIRPTLLLLACKAAGGDENDALPYACAVEYIHNYSLIHDDLPAMDDDDMRRGMPANHKVFGEAMAILAGDGLLSAAFGLMHEDYLWHAGDQEALRRRVCAGAAIAAACGPCGMVAGQAADIEAEGLDAGPGLLDFIHLHKTAALIRASLAAGARLGGAAPDMANALADYGENLGLAFQIADDVLDAEGDTKAIGKTAGKDEKAGKATYPGLHGTEASRARLEALTERAVRAAAESGIDVYYIDIFTALARSLAHRGK